MQKFSFEYTLHHTSDSADASRLAVLFFDDSLQCLSPSLFDKNSSGLRELLTHSLFDGKLASMVCLPGQTISVDMPSVLCVGLGKSSKLEYADLQRLGTKIAKYAMEHKQDDIRVFLPCAHIKPVEQLKTALGLCRGLWLGSYSFNQFKSNIEDEPHRLTTAIIHPDVNKWQQPLQQLQYMVQGQLYAKDLMHLPPNILTPVAFAEKAQDLTAYGVTVEIFDENKLLDERMHALLAVGQGSSNPPRLAIMHWPGISSNEKPTILVGKGICYDSGGLNLKTSMQVDMKYDMGGAAAVVGTMLAVAKQKHARPVIGIIALAENMPDGNAYRPSDVIQTRSGQSVAVLNTDAEGRLALADALDYAVTTYKPRAIVDLATLTGAMLVSLGHHYAGIFCNDGGLCDDLSHAGLMMSEPIWQMPLDERYDKMIDSPIADMQNLGQPSVAGSITAAQFLQRFVKKLPWAHIDIAGTAWIPSGNGVHDKGPTGWGVALLCQYLHNVAKK